MSDNVFTLASAKEMPNGAFYAVIKLNGKKVGEVSNDGRGGMDLFQFKDFETRQLFTKAAKDAMGADVEFEVEGQFVTRLFLLNRLNSVRVGVVVVDSPEDYWENGRYGIVKQSGATNEQIVKAMKVQTPERIVWNKETQEFVPARTL